MQMGIVEGEENFKLFGFSLSAGRWALNAWVGSSELGVERLTLNAERLGWKLWVGG
jgi:hypothetical protein